MFMTRITHRSGTLMMSDVLNIINSDLIHYQHVLLHCGSIFVHNKSEMGENWYSFIYLIWKKNLNSSVVCHLKLVEKNNVKFLGSTPNKDRQNSGILVILVALIGGNVTVVEREWLQWRIIANHQKILRSEICSNLIGTYMYGYACQVSTNQQTRQQLENSPVV